MKSLLISGNACYHLVHVSCHMRCKITKFKIHRITFTFPVKDVKIKIYRTTNVAIVLYGCQSWSLLLRKGHTCTLWCLNVGYQGRYWDLSGRKLPETVGNCIFMWFMMCTPHQILYV